MQVTFNNASRGWQKTGESGGTPISVLTFQIDYRGKTYDCVGHLKPVAENGSANLRLTLAGYYGYNGPIDIQKLQKAAEDYYHNVMANDGSPGLRVVHDDEGHVVVNMHNEFDIAPAASKSYAFNVGRIDYDQEALQKVG
jgi:hypothetical protein